MSPHARTFLIWAPRVAGVAVSLFLALFALDAFDGGPLTETVPAFLVHLLPTAIVGAAVAVAWRHPWFGAAAFGALALGYAAMVPSRPDWILIVGGPLAVTAALFALGALRNRSERRHSRAGGTGVP